jgi:nucleoid DNA-binding protein/cell division septation protein DedD
MKIGIYISELLFEHESVILPGFGEFYTRYNPARFVPEIQKVESPSKTVAFNPGKKEGETLLPAYIASKEKMDEGLVQKYLQDYVAEVRQVLEGGNKFEMEKVGIFSMGPDGMPVLEPDTSVNYLTDAMGMPPVKTPEKAGMQQPGTGGSTGGVKPAPLKEEAPPVQEDKPGKAAGAELPSALRWLAYTVIPLLVIIIILALNFNFFFGEGGLFRTSKKEPVRSEQPATPVSEPETGTAAVTETPVQTDETRTDIPERDETPAAAEPAAPVTQPALTTADAARPEAGRPVYYIVVGSFPDRQSAENLVSRLRGQGVSQAGIFMQTAAGYHRVAYGFYYDLAEAERILPGVKESVNREAYILHR